MAATVPSGAPSRRTRPRGGRGGDETGPAARGRGRRVRGARVRAACPVFFWEDYGHWCCAEAATVDALFRDRRLGREAPGGNAVALIEIDGELPEDVLARVRALPQVQQAKPLKF